jgi:IS4 transposase
MQEVLKGLPRDGFDRMVRERGSDKHTKGFNSWAQLVTMVYGQLAEVVSLRQLEAGFNSQSTHHYHLGCRAVSRSTLADANANRDPALFEAVLRSLMTKAERTARRDIGKLLVALDSTSITLKGRSFDDWTATARTRNTQGVKLHVGYAVDRKVPISQSITAANVNDIEEAVKLPLEAGTTYVFDKGYCDYNWWHRIDRVKAVFVTRFKRNAGLTQVAERRIPKSAAGLILADEVVRLKHRNPSGGRFNDYQKPLRRVTVARPGHERPLVLATNDLKSPAVQIAAIYKDRWNIELFFKWIKQHLRIKRFLGRSENAVRIQILTALISYLLLALYRQRHGLKQTLWTLLAEVRATLFQRPGIETHWYRLRQRARDQFAQLQPALFT